MISKNQYEYYKSKLRKLGQMVFEFEATNEAYQALQAYNDMPQSKKEQLHKKWDDYYVQCSMSEAANLFREMNKAYNVKDKTRVAEILAKSKKWQESGKRIPKPSSIDPSNFHLLLKDYYAMLTKIQEYKDILEDSQDVYDKKAESLL